MANIKLEVGFLGVFLALYTAATMAVAGAPPTPPFLVGTTEPEMALAMAPTIGPAIDATLNTLSTE